MTFSLEPNCNCRKPTPMRLNPFVQVPSRHGVDGIWLGGCNALLLAGFENFLRVLCLALRHVHF